MFMQGSNRIRTLFNRLHSSRETVKLNQGAVYIVSTRTMANSEVGSGSGKGGGSGGSIREAGGSLGRKGAAQEDQYFNRESKALKDKLKQHLKDEIKKHEDAIKKNHEIMQEIEKQK